MHGAVQACQVVQISFDLTKPSTLLLKAMWALLLDKGGSFLVPLQVQPQIRRVRVRKNA